MGAIMISTGLAFLLVTSSALAQVEDSPPIVDKWEDRVLSSSVAAPPDFFSYYGKITRTLVSMKDLHVRTLDGQVVHVPQATLEVDLQNLRDPGHGLRLDLRNVKFPNGVRQIRIVELDADVRTCGADGVYNDQNQMACRLCTCDSIRFVSDQAYLLENDIYLLKVAFEPIRELNVDHIKTTTQKFRCRSVYGTKPVCTAMEAPVTESKVQCKLANRRQSIVSVVRLIDEF